MKQTFAFFTGTCRNAAVMLCATLLFLPGCKSQASLHTRDGQFLDTVVSVSVFAQKKRADTVLAHCMDMLAEFHTLFSPRGNGSDIAKINAAAGQEVEVSPHTARMLSEALTYCELTGGAFDVTIGAVSCLWDFHTPSPSPPDAALVADKAKHVDYRTLAVTQNTVMLKNPLSSVDVGGVAKGYIADRLGEYLSEQQDIPGALINLGGNVATVSGNPARKGPWVIGIADPFDERRTVQTIDSENSSVVTSGIGQRGYYYEDKWYHHLLNPETGMPADNGLASVTVVCKSSAMADALSTACFVLGEQQGMELIGGIDGAEVMFCGREGEITSSPGWSGK